MDKIEKKNVYVWSLLLGLSLCALLPQAQAQSWQDSQGAAGQLKNQTYNTDMSPQFYTQQSPRNNAEAPQHKSFQTGSQTGSGTNGPQLLKAQFGGIAGQSVNSAPLRSAGYTFGFPSAGGSSSSGSGALPGSGSGVGGSLPGSGPGVTSFQATNNAAAANNILNQQAQQEATQFLQQEGQIQSQINAASNVGDSVRNAAGAAQRIINSGF